MNAGMEQVTIANYKHSEPKQKMEEKKVEN